MSTYKRIDKFCLALFALISVNGDVNAQNAPENAVLDKYIQERMDDNQVPGLAIVVLKQGEPAWIRGFGEAAPGRAVKPETAFMLGSVSKSFTALAISQLIEQGKINPKAPVQQYLPHFRLADEKKAAAITVAHLLHHNSSLSQNESYSTSRPKQSLEERMLRLGELHTEGVPGEAYQYANINYALLGLIVEKVSGMQYEAYVRQHIFSPLQMHHGFTTQQEAKAKGAAEGYHLWFGSPQAANIDYPEDNLPSGHLMASAADLSHYLQMLLQKGLYKDTWLLREAEAKKLLAPADNSFYARGWKRGEVEGIPAIYHGGTLANYNTFVAMDPDGKWAYAVLMNVNSFLARGQLRSVAEGVAPLLAGRAAPKQLLTVSRLYLLVNVLVLLGLFFFIRSLYRKYWEISAYLWEEDIAATPGSPWKPLVFDCAVAALVVVLPPATMNVSWKQMASSQPDLVYLLLLMLLISFFSGIFLAYVRFSHRQRLLYIKKATVG